VNHSKELRRIPSESKDRAVGISRAVRVNSLQGVATAVTAELGAQGYRVVVQELIRLIEIKT
jgi:hypothetical protein